MYTIGTGRGYGPITNPENTMCASCGGFLLRGFGVHDTRGGWRCADTRACEAHRKSLDISLYWQLEFAVAPEHFPPVAQLHGFSRATLGYLTGTVCRHAALTIQRAFQDLLEGK